VVAWSRVAIQGEVMADIAVRRESGGALQPTGYPEPYRMLRDLMTWDPFREMAPAWPVAMEGGMLDIAFEVKETPTAYLFHADVPGIKEPDLEVTVNGNRLTVSGKREEEKEDKTETYYTRERTYGAFTRSFTLPDGTDCDHVQADLKNGVLSIAVAKKSPTPAKKIAIKAQTSGAKA